MKGLSDAEIEMIVSIATVKSYFAGDVIVRQFSKESDLMVVLSGQVRIDTFSGERIAEGAEGCVIGEISLLDDKPRSATVTSIGQTQVAVLPAAAFRQLLDSDPIMGKTILLNIGQVLCMRLRAADIQLDTIVGRGYLRNTGKS